MYYLNARYYAPSVAGFITQDSYRGTYEDPKTWNLYAYCAGNPVGYTDPTGHAVETIFDIISLGSSIFELIKNPSWANAGYLGMDIGATILPFVPGSYSVKGVKVAVNFTGDVADATKGAKNAGNAVETVTNASKIKQSAKGISEVVEKGKWQKYKTVDSYVLKVKGHNVQVTGKIMNGKFTISDAWVIK